MYQALVTQMKSTLVKLKFRLVLKNTFYLSPGTTYILGKSLCVRSKGQRKNAPGYSDKS